MSAENSQAAALMSVLVLEERDPDVFVGKTPDTRMQRIFGGQVAGQALMAAASTLPEGRAVHSLHSYFLRPGDPNEEIRYAVERMRDGRTFSTRRVVAWQRRGGKDVAIFALTADASAGETPYAEHALPMPDVPAPESLPTFEELLAARGEEGRAARSIGQAVEQRLIEHPFDRAPKTYPDTKSWTWMRVAGELPDDLAEADDETLARSFKGNLCRCTGYRPIIDAAVRMTELPRAEFDRAAVADALRSLQRANGATYVYENRSFHAPRTLDELVALRAANPQALILAGSTDVGRQIARAVAGTQKKLTLELGGKAANIVFDHAPADQAVAGIVQGIFFNQGHVCCAGSRLLVQESVHDEVIAALQRRIGTLRVGDPLDKNTDIGAINSAEQLARIRELSEIGEAEGAQRWQPACELPERGFWFPPTVFTDVSLAHRIARDEVFGPVLSVLTFRTPDEAVAKANNSTYGLSAGIWSEKGSRILKIADQLRAGVVWANTFNKFDPTSPFGGYKQSGYGREGGRHGLAAYLKGAQQ